MAKKNIPATPLTETKDSFGTHKETPRKRTTTKDSFGTHSEPGGIGITQRVNGVDYVMPADPRDPK